MTIMCKKEPSTTAWVVIELHLLGRTISGRKRVKGPTKGRSKRGGRTKGPRPNRTETGVRRRRRLKWG